ncbi:MAG TPA: winged helix-turn-helix domain-containing protein [Bryobacteraceae bacterium]|nr:winged helix-turn-helix domain-containing protein [Bryobacteraceae bacterium]
MAVYRFGVFELDTTDLELRKGGTLIKLAPQPLLLLQFFLQNPGELRTRQEIQQAIWGTENQGDVDRNLNVCIAQVRDALRDDSESPRFIQTVPRRGYRFIAPVETVGAANPAETVRAAPRVAPRRPIFIVAAAVILLIATVTLVARHRAALKVDPGERLKIAVLPFRNLNCGEECDVFVEGLTGETISQLGVLQNRIGVIAQTSAMSLKNTNKGLEQIGKDLHVNYVVEGNVQQNADVVRITARITSVADQSQLWSETYERARSDLFSTEQELAARVAKAVVDQVVPGEPVMSWRRQVLNKSAYEDYTRGRYLANKGDIADLQRAMASFEKAAAADGTMSDAFTALADVNVQLGRATDEPANLQKAKPAAEKALLLNDRDAAAHNALADTLFFYDWNWVEAERHFKRAIDLNPSLAAAHHDYAWFLVATGHPEEGLMSLRRALAFDPLSQRINVDAGWLFLQAHKFAEATEHMQRMLDLEPSFGEARACLMRSLELQGRFKEAAAQLQYLVRDTQLKAELASLSPQQALRKSYELALARSPSHPYSIAVMAALEGDSGEALKALDQAFQMHSVALPLMKTEPSFAPLHDDARFEALVKKVGIP